MMTVPKPDNRRKTKLEKIQEWKERGPFRVWRNNQHLSMRDAASYIGVSLFTIQAWEGGNAIPTPENMSMLIGVTENAELRNQWHEWWKEGPEGKHTKYYPYSR